MAIFHFEPIHILSVIDVVIPPLRFAKAFNRNPWDSLSIMGEIETPILFISGLRDELVPPHHVKLLHDSAIMCRIRHFFVVENGTHNDTWYRGGRQYRQAIRSFVDTVTSSAPPVATRGGFSGFEDNSEESSSEGGDPMRLSGEEGDDAREDL